MIKISILAPEWNRTLEADAVFLPGVMGEFEILKDHAPIISALSAGRIRWRIGEQEESLEINGGIARLDNNALCVCTETAQKN